MASARAVDRASVAGYAGASHPQGSGNGARAPAVTKSLTTKAQTSTAAARAADRGSVKGYAADGRPAGKSAKTAASPAPTGQRKIRS